MARSDDGRLLCPACGSPVTPALGSCSWCGRALDDAVDAPPAPAEAAPVPSAEDPTTGKPRLRRRSWLIGGAAAAVVAAGTVVVVLLTTGGSAPPDPLDQRAQDARDVAAALSGLADDPAAVRATGQALAGVDPRAAVPTGAKVLPEETTWRPDGAGGGVMTVSLTRPDGTTATYLAVVVHEDAGWRVLQTFPAPVAASSSASSSAPVSPTAVAS